MTTNNQIKANQEISNHLGNQMKEIEKEIKKIVKMFREEEGGLWASENETYMQESRDKLNKLRLKLKLLKQLQKQIKEVRGELKRDFNKFIDRISKEGLLEDFDDKDIAEMIIDEIFKNKFGDEENDNK